MKFELAKESNDTLIVGLRSTYKGHKIEVICAIYTSDDMWHDTHYITVDGHTVIDDDCDNCEDFYELYEWHYSFMAAFDDEDFINAIEHNVKAYLKSDVFKKLQEAV